MEYRYAHEYGEISITMPSAPSIPKPGKPLSARREKVVNPKDMFENALKASSNGTLKTNPDVTTKTNGIHETITSNGQVPVLSSDSVVPSKKMVPTASYGAYESKNLFEQALASAGSKGKTVQPLVNGQR